LLGCKSASGTALVTGRFSLHMGVVGYDISILGFPGCTIPSIGIKYS